MASPFRMDGGDRELDKLNLEIQKLNLEIALLRVSGAANDPLSQKENVVPSTPLYHTETTHEAVFITPSTPLYYLNM
jgi:hypothetical protein